MWRHPKYYKELRKLRNKLDRAISSKNSTEESERSPGPGLKPQASSSKPQATSSQDEEDKTQAPSCKGQASSHKRQAP
jgi:hypothetical protein